MFSVLNIRMTPAEDLFNSILNTIQKCKKTHLTFMMSQIYIKDLHTLTSLFTLSSGKIWTLLLVILSIKCQCILQEEGWVVLAMTTTLIDMRRYKFWLWVYLFGIILNLFIVLTKYRPVTGAFHWQLRAANRMWDIDKSVFAMIKGSNFAPHFSHRVFFMNHSAVKP